MTEVLPNFVVVGGLAVVALCLTVWRGGIKAGAGDVRRAVRIAAIATAGQVGHFIEEAATGLPERFPEIFGFAPVPLGFFVSVNMACLVLWVLSVWGLARRFDGALFPLWFLGVAGVANGVLHPVLALRVGGYFPGLVTSALMGVLGVLLVVRLARVTGSARAGA